MVFRSKKHFFSKSPSYKDYLDEYKYIQKNIKNNSDMFYITSKLSDLSIGEIREYIISELMLIIEEMEYNINSKFEAYNTQEENNTQNKKELKDEIEEIRKKLNIYQKQLYEWDFDYEYIIDNYCVEDHEEKQKQIIEDITYHGSILVGGKFC